MITVIKRDNRIDKWIERGIKARSVKVYQPIERKLKEEGKAATRDPGRVAQIIKVQRKVQQRRQQEREGAEEETETER